MKITRIYDLSHTIIPAREEYRLEIDTRLVDQWEQFAQYKRINNQWYVISEVAFNTHVGTHIEFPYHHFQDGLDAARYPLESLIGDAIVLDISRWGNNECISLAELQKIAEGRIQKGDIVYFHTGLDRYYRTEKQHFRPWFATEAIDWLVSLGIKVMGVDTSGIEVRNSDGSASIGQPNHERLLGAGIALVEYMTNLAPLINKRFQTFILPVKLVGAEAFPVRVIGIETES